MIRGWYIGASGMNAQQYRLDAISNNLANVDTTGYKRDVAVSKNFPELLLRRTNDDGVRLIPPGSEDRAPVIGKLGLGVELNELYTVFEQGSFKQSDSNTDVALSGSGFLAVQTPLGERYTRNGNFIVGKEGYLETKEGYPVLGENGYIDVQDIGFIINKDGQIFSEENMEFIDRLKVVAFDDDRYLRKMGGSMYASNEISGEAFIAEGVQRPGIMQGFTETSNVNVINEMVQMIEVNRAYEANQKTVQAEDTLMSTLWGRVVNIR